MNYKIQRIVKRENTYELWYNVLDDEGRLILGNALFPAGEKIPDACEIEDIFQKKIFPQMAMDETLAESNQRTYMQDEITKILRDKKYISNDQKFSEDMPDAPIKEPALAADK